MIRIGCLSKRGLHDRFNFLKYQWMSHNKVHGSGYMLLGRFPIFWREGADENLFQMEPVLSRVRLGVGLAVVSSYRPDLIFLLEISTVCAIYRR